MTNSEKKYYNKKFLPTYMRNINIALPTVIIAVLVIGLVAVFLVPEDFKTPALIALIATFVVTLIVLLIVFGVFNKKLVAQRKAELEEDLPETGFEEAKAALTERGVINETGFVITTMEKMGDVVPVLPYKDAKIYLFSANLCSKIITVVSFCNQAGGVMAEYLLDKDLYNYLKYAGFDIVYYGGSNMIFGDKGTFVKKVIRTKSSKGMGYAFLGGALGAALAAKAQDETPEMDAVLRVLRKENI